MAMQVPFLDGELLFDDLDWEWQAHGTRPDCTGRRFHLYVEHLKRQCKQQEISRPQLAIVVACVQLQASSRWKIAIQTVFRRKTCGLVEVQPPIGDFVAFHESGGTEFVTVLRRGTYPIELSDDSALGLPEGWL
jgi:hypothetical protein